MERKKIFELPDTDPVKGEVKKGEVKSNRKKARPEFKCPYCKYKLKWDELKKQKPKDPGIFSSTYKCPHCKQSIRVVGYVPGSGYLAYKDEN